MIIAIILSLLVAFILLYIVFKNVDDEDRSSKDYDEELKNWG